MSGKCAEDEIFENCRTRDERQNHSRVSDKKNIRRIPSRRIVEKETKGREQVKFLRLYNTGPFITVSATTGYIVASAEAFSLDGISAEISSNVNMYAPSSIYSVLKVLCFIAQCLRRPFNDEIKYFHRAPITHDRPYAKRS